MAVVRLNYVFNSHETCFWSVVNQCSKKPAVTCLACLLDQELGLYLVRYTNDVEVYLLVAMVNQNLGENLL